MKSPQRILFIVAVDVGRRGGRDGHEEEENRRSVCVACRHVTMGACRRRDGALDVGSITTT